MAYIILADKERELDRRELHERIVIGRAPDCDVKIRDILLSRHHCAIEPMGEQWVIADLGSKNGTFVAGQAITRHVFDDGDVVHMGRTRLCFRTGAFVPAPEQTRQHSRASRPSDPIEALAGTVAGFRYVEEEAELADVSEFPRPRPRPPTPNSYQLENVHELVSDIASSSWDSIIAGASQKVPPERPLPVPMVLQRKPDNGDEAHQALRVLPTDRPSDPISRKPPAARRWREKLAACRWVCWTTIVATLAGFALWLRFVSMQW
jgi:pSer/pThr/pTyr-binding forkhead associated (FHA) protein